MKYIIFTFSLWFISLNSLGVSELITSLEGNEICMGSDLVFQARFLSYVQGRIVKVSLRDQNRNFITTNIGSVAIEIPHENIYFDPASRITHKIEHTRDFIVKVKIHCFTSDLYLHLSTEEPPQEESKIYRLIFSAPAKNIHILSTNTEPTEIDDAKPLVTAHEAPIGDPIDSENISIEVQVRAQKSSGWNKDQQPWEANTGRMHNVGKGRRVIITSPNGLSLQVSLTKREVTQDSISALYLSNSEKTADVASLTVGPGQNSIFLNVRRSQGFFRLGEIYDLKITDGVRKLIYSIVLQSHHFESRNTNSNDDSRPTYR